MVGLTVFTKTNHYLTMLINALENSRVLSNTAPYYTAIMTSNQVLSQKHLRCKKGEAKKVQVTERPKYVITVRPRKKATPARLHI